VKAAFMTRLKPETGIPVRLTVRFYPPRPGRPGLDNLLKSAADKRYAADKTGARLSIAV
jgi:Holliday junction resolvase RusA-like endonuclease